MYKFYRFFSFAFLLIFAASGFSQQKSGSNYKPLGKIIDIGSTKLHLYCLGRGSPTTILDAGAGGWSIHLLELQRELAKATRVCSYDRAGFGWSSVGILPRTAKQDAIELHDLLKNSGEKPPFVLVGNSYGGYVVRLYFDMFSDDVAGIALIDSGHEKQWTRLPIAKQMLEFGIVDLKEKYQKACLGQVKKEEFQADLPSDVLPIYRDAMMQSKTQEANISTLENIIASAEQLGKTRKLGNLPLLVFSAGNSFAAFVEDNEENRPLLEDLNKGWMELQYDLAKLSTNSLHLISAKSKHGISRENPKLVASVLNLLITNIRK